MTGKQKCEFLRGIRMQIAKDNGITYLSKDCGNESENCYGTCAICDAEARYLNYEINEKARRGENINISCVNLNDYFDNYEVTEKEKPNMAMGDISIDLTYRSYNCLKRAGVKTIDELTMYSEDEISRVRNLGKRSLKDVKEKLAALNLSFKNYE